jgi:phenylpropionate dioxygenase-like ring-hydroxylating dioxygenase large terminal subunit
MPVANGHNKKSARKNGKAPQFEQTWYALGMSSDLAIGQIIGKDFLGGRVIIDRGANGKASVMSAYCRHLGADLSVGCVIDNDVRCAFHHWQYGDDGKCTRIPVSDKIPAKAKLFKFPTAEKWGLIWAFNGAEPLFDVPSFRSFDESELTYRTAPGFDIPVQPCWVPFTNSVDFQHLRVLHGLKIDFDPRDIRMRDYDFEYDVKFEDPNYGIFDQQIRVTGTNTIALTGELNGMKILSMATGTPTPDGRTVGWMITGAPKPKTEAEKQAVEGQIAIGEAFFRRLIEEDQPVMSSIRFREGILLEADRALARFLKYVRSFPKASPASAYM